MSNEEKSLVMQATDGVKTLRVVYNYKSNDSNKTNIINDSNSNITTVYVKDPIDVVDTRIIMDFFGEEQVKMKLGYEYIDMKLDSDESDSDESDSESEIDDELIRQLKELRSRGEISDNIKGCVDKLITLKSSTPTDLTESYELVKSLSGGKSGALVYKVKLLNSESEYILKFYTAKNLNRPFRDLLTLCRLSGNDGFPEVYDIGYSVNPVLWSPKGKYNMDVGYYVVMSIMPGEPLSQVNIKMSKNEALTLSLNILHRLMQMRNILGKDFEHYDLHPNNIFIDRDNCSSMNSNIQECPSVYIIDYDLAKAENIKFLPDVMQQSFKKKGFLGLSLVVPRVTWSFIKKWKKSLVETMKKIYKVKNITNTDIRNWMVISSVIFEVNGITDTLEMCENAEECIKKNIRIYKNLKTPNYTDYSIENKYNNIEPTKEVVSVIVTHENRLKCALRDIIGSAHDYKNCCIIKLSLRIVNNVNNLNNQIYYDISLIYDGETHKKDRVYYTGNNDIINENDILFPNLNDTTSKLLNLNATDLNQDIQYTFFMIRHAQSDHNLYNKLQKLKSPLKLDTSITPVGKRQSENAGMFLNKYLTENNLNIDYLFSSDLKRTRQTLSVILSKITIPMNNNKITVIPCSHEILYTKKENCDKNMVLSVKSIAGENRMSCDPKKCSKINEKDQCCQIKYENTKLDIDWTYYNDFYDGKTRKFTYLTANKYSCSNNDFIQMMVLYINSMISY